MGFVLVNRSAPGRLRSRYGLRNGPSKPLGDRCRSARTASRGSKRHVRGDRRVPGPGGARAVRPARRDREMVPAGAM